MCARAHSPLTAGGLAGAGDGRHGGAGVVAEQAGCRDVDVARTHWPASHPGVLQAPGMAVTGLPALSTEHAVLP